MVQKVLKLVVVYDICQRSIFFRLPYADIIRYSDVLISLSVVVSNWSVIVTDVCRQLLATGLSGLYSSLPRRLEYPSDDWNHFSAEDVVACPALTVFLNSLEFCNAVVQVAYFFIYKHFLAFCI